MTADPLCRVCGESCDCGGRPHETTCGACSICLELHEESCAGCDICADENPREKGDDDGLTYGDPRDHRDGRE